jgi:hypothetical protein
MSAIAAVILATLAVAPSPSPSPTPIPYPCSSLSAIVTRPTVTTSVCTVQPQTALIESGWQNLVATGNGAGYTASYPQAFVRVGTGDPNLEWNVSVPTYEKTNAGGSIVTGWSDVSGGIKYVLGYNAKAAWGVNAAFSMPTGGSSFTAGGPGYTGNFNWTYTLNGTFSLAGTLGFNDLAGYRTDGLPGRYFAFAPSLGLFASLPNNTELFAEYAYSSAAGPGIGGKSTIDAGIERDLSPNVQFDLEYGFSPTPVNGTRTTYTGAGLSFLFGGL